MCVLLGICVRFEAKGNTKAESYPVSVCISSDNVEYLVRGWVRDTDCIVFLPSFAESDKMTWNISGTDRIFLDGKELTNGMACSGLNLNDDHILLIGENHPITIKFVQSANIETLFLNTSSGDMHNVHADKVQKERAEIALISENGEQRYHTRSTDWIRGHGNSTWNLEKKSYNLYLGMESDLLGTDEPQKKYVLLSNAIDDTCLRNYLVYRFAKNVGGYESFAPDCAFVDLYLNGNYTGLYLLCEKPAVEGYEELFEITSYSAPEDGQVFRLDSGRYVEIHSPDPCTDIQKTAIQKRVQNFVTELMEDDELPDELDLDSWARKYLVEEVFMNSDAGFYSQYFYRDPFSESFYAGPCWDYDGAIGMYDYFPNCFLAQREYMTATMYSPFYSKLWQNQVFRDEVITLYRQEYLPVLNDLIKHAIPETENAIHAASKMNLMRWYDNTVDSYTSVSDMKSFLEKRIAFLNKAWIDGVNYHTITLKRSPSAVYLYYCIEDGLNGTELPNPADIGAEGEMWYREDTGEVYDEQVPVTEDFSLTAYNPI